MMFKKIPILLNRMIQKKIKHKKLNSSVSFLSSKMGLIQSLSLSNKKDLKTNY